jgi:polysaccharide deacetylase family protein (PEP-CTERM system associated)
MTSGSAARSGQSSRTARVSDSAVASVSVRGDRMFNAFSVDVEEYFQVEAFKSIVDRASWDGRPSRLVESTDRVLRLLEAADVRGTFFVLGWVAERFPALVRRIQAGGHEIASHGHAHEPARLQTRNEFRDDVRRAKQTLENCTGTRVRGYRAPTFSIGKENWWAYEVLAEEGYDYSSSIYPVAHDLYGMPSAPRTPFHPIRASEFLEIPVATVRLLARNRPCGGGGYFRLMPYALSRWCMLRVNRVDRISCVFYCHPWEFDPDQPRLRHAPLKSRFRHYLNIGHMEHRVSRLLRDFSWGRMDEVYLPNSCPSPGSSH